MGARAETTRAAGWVDSRTYGVSGTHPSASQCGVGGWPGVLGVGQGGGAAPVSHLSCSFFSPDPNSRPKPRREGYHRGDHVWGPNCLHTHPSPGTVYPLSDALTGMAVLPWIPRSLGLFSSTKGLISLLFLDF